MITLTELRNDIYNKIGHVIETGVPIEVDYKGHIVHITSAEHPSKLSRITKKDIIVGDPDSIIYNDWIKEWRSDLP